MAEQAPDPNLNAFPPAILYKSLKVRNENYLVDFWARCRALYSGGPTLLENKAILKQILPQHSGEDPLVWEERAKRAFYIPYPGSIVDKIVSELMAKPLTFEQENTTADASDGGQAGASDLTEQEKQLPPFYMDLVKNSGKPGGAKMSLNQFAREQMFTALQCKTAWALIDLPKQPENGYANRAEQEKAGGLKAYICPLDPECVVDWEEREDGELEWALIEDKICKRQGLAGDRNIVTMRWRYYTVDAWAVYELTYDKKRRQDGPNDRDTAVLVDQGKHSFKKVPVRRLCLPDGLWAMGKLEAIARAHFNQRNALSWGQLKALFPVPVLYLQKPEPGDDISSDVGRASQTHGQGYLRVLAEKDKMEYFSPDTAPYKIAMEDLAGLRDEMHRVLHHMAMSVDNSGAALQRSGESKAIDQAAAAVILRALGVLLKEHLEELLGIVATGRADNIAFCAHGMDSFDDITLSQLVIDAIGIESVSIPSAHFNKLWKLKVAKIALGPDANEEDIDQISEELEGVVTQDSFEAESDAKLAQHGANQASAEAKQEDPTGMKGKQALAKLGPIAKNEDSDQKKELAGIKKVQKKPGKGK
jgi:hypothetical protein